MKHSDAERPSSPVPADWSAATIEDEAAEWLVLRQAGLDAPQAAEFEQWRASSPQHARAFAALEQTWATLNQPRTTGHAARLADLLEMKEQRRARRRQRALTLATAGLAVAAAAVVLLFTRPAPPRVAPATPATVAVRPDRQTLPDGSVIECNAATDFVVNFSPGKREVKLLRGEALFEVAHDAARPFVVTTGVVEVRAVGTAFSVRRDSQRIDVIVTHGRVAIERVAAEAPAVSSAAPLYLGAGHRVVMPADLPLATPLQVQSITPDEMAAALNWRGRRVEFSGITVGEAAALFNRQNERQLEVTDPAVAEIKLSGIFWSDDPDGFARLLEKGMDVRAERSPAAIVLRRR